MDTRTVRKVSLEINKAHRFVFMIPEALEQAAKFGVTSSEPAGPAYFAFRSAAMGAVPWQVVAAAFYNWSPLAVRAMTGVWDAAPPEQWQSARFEAVGRAMRRVGVSMSAHNIAEARSLIDQVVAHADYACKPVAAANSSVELPADPLVALWQQITILREWRGGAHYLVLAANRLGPCDCNVVQTATGRFPLAIARATLWDDHEWAEASSRLVTRGWLNADGTATDVGIAAREKIELETDHHCAVLWEPIGETGAHRLAELIMPIDQAFEAAGR